jgi:hypothetical protein
LAELKEQIRLVKKEMEKVTPREIKAIEQADKELISEQTVSI